MTNFSVKPQLICVIGASGVGKSTLISGTLKSLRTTRADTKLIRKDTTRTLRGFAERAECRNINRFEFQRRLIHGEYVIHYEIFGEAYGVRSSEIDLAKSSTAVYIQTFPTAVAEEIRSLLRSRFNIRICLLEASAEIIYSRLLNRGDEGTIRTLEDRMRTVARPRRQVADHVIDASYPADVVLTAFLDWLSSNLPA